MNPRLMRAAPAFWMRGAIAIWGPLVVLLPLFVGLVGAVGVLQVTLGLTPWGRDAICWAAGLTAILGPWFVTRGWIERDRR